MRPACRGSCSRDFSSLATASERPRRPSCPTASPCFSVCRWTRRQEAAAAGAAGGAGCCARRRASQGRPPRGREISSSGLVGIVEGSPFFTHHCLCVVAGPRARNCSATHRPKRSALARAAWSNARLATLQQSTACAAAKSTCREQSVNSTDTRRKSRQSTNATIRMRQYLPTRAAAAALCRLCFVETSVSTVKPASDRHVPRLPAPDRSRACRSASVPGQTFLVAVCVSVGCKSTRKKTPAGAREQASARGPQAAAAR